MQVVKSREVRVIRFTASIHKTLTILLKTEVPAGTEVELEATQILVE